MHTFQQQLVMKLKIVANFPSCCDMFIGTTAGTDSIDSFNSRIEVDLQWCKYCYITTEISAARHTAEL